ncbi:MAG: hypothetical protein K9L30_16485 [Desulfobacterales bacterium]|nr:hypothetical protein [Desulfobacterales bacterium]
MKKLFQAGILLIMMLLVSSCSRSDLDLQAEEYNNFVSEKSKIIFKLGKEMGNEFLPYLKGETVDAIVVRAKYDEITDHIADICMELRDMSIPQSDKVADFHKVLMAYLDLADKQFGKDFDELVRLVETDNPASGDATAKFVSIIQSTMNEEEIMLKEIKEAQREMAKKHKFKITAGEETDEE